MADPSGILSAEQIDVLQKKLIYLRCIRRSELSKKLDQIKALDDLSDNEEYHLRLYELARLEAIIKLLEQKLDRALQANKAKNRSNTCPDTEFGFTG